MSDKASFAVIGAGNAGFGLAADLTLKGFDTRLYELPEFKAAIEPVWESGGIRLKGVTGEGFARVPVVTTDMGEALDGVDAILVAVPAYGHRRMAEVMASHIESGQVVVLLPGNFGGAIEFRKLLLELGAPGDVVVSEGSSFIFACKKDGPDGVWVRGLKVDMPLAALPAEDTQVALDLVNQAYQMSAASNVLETSLNNINHIGHPPPMILNAGRIDSQGGGWSVAFEGETEAVCRVSEMMDQERVQVLKAFGLPPTRLLDWYHILYGHQGMKGDTIYEAMSNTPIHGPAKAPDTLEHRYITEDVPYGLVPIASLAHQVAIETPHIDAIITLASAALGRDFRARGRTMESLGLAGLTKEEILEYVNTGRRPPKEVLV